MNKEIVIYRHKTNKDIYLIRNWINAGDLCNDFFESPAGKEYLNMRERIDRMGEK